MTHRSAASARARMPRPQDELAFGVRRGLLIAAAVGALALPPLGQANLAPVHASAGSPAAMLAAVAQPAAPTFRLADFGNEQPSPQARHVADWSVDANDHAGKPFVVVDKQQARVYVFGADGRLNGASPVLLGLAVGDDSVPGIGERPIPLVKPEERTTPAGRFIGERGSNTTGEDVVWVDYDAAVSMHRVRPLVAAERRLERLASPTPQDNRISYGCINVPAAFFDAHIEPLFRRMHAVVYVLPETRPVQAVFGSYDVQTRHAVVPPVTPG